VNCRIGGERASGTFEQILGGRGPWPGIGEAADRLTEFGVVPARGAVEVLWGVRG
jgi:hypothetical protein